VIFVIQNFTFRDGEFKYLYLTTTGKTNYSKWLAGHIGLGITLKNIVSSAFQQNGAVEKAFVTLYSWIRLLLNRAGFTEGLVKVYP
jgi:hypothetical protein